MSSRSPFLSAAAARSTDAGCRPCADCGGLECLCRPRFFAGQLLTEDELNQLEQYVVNKNRLHNRHLHGWGVVCGLDVVCDECGAGVVVKPGYALSPCGDDIVVCRDRPVDVCALIEACRKQHPNRCAPDDVPDARDELEDWIIAIRYHERQSRGVKPLRTGASSCGCGCGGSGCGCGCGGHGGQPDCRCGGHTGSHQNGCGCGKNGNGKGNGNGKNGNGKTAAAGTARCTTPLECEATQICEDFCFDVFKAPRTDPERGGFFDFDDSALGKQFIACLQPLLDSLPSFPTDPNDKQELSDFIRDLRAALLEFLLHHPSYDCLLSRRVSQVVPPDPNLGDAEFFPAFQQAGEELLLVFAELLFACFCFALMPPCPAPVENNRVPLARITVRTTPGCKVVSICNWTVLRKYATTFPSLQYWLSPLVFGRLLRELLESFCCDLFANINQPDDDDFTPNPDFGGIEPEQPVDTGSTVPGFIVFSRPGPGRRSTTSGRTGSSSTGAGRTNRPGPVRPKARTTARARALIDLGLTSGLKTQPTDPARIAAGLLGATDDKGDPLISMKEQSNLLHFIALDQMVAPLLRTLAGGRLSDLGGGTALLSMARAFMAGAAPSGAEPLEARMRELEQKLAEQQRTIDELRRQR